MPPRPTSSRISYPGTAGRDEAGTSTVGAWAASSDGRVWWRARLASSVGWGFGSAGCSLMVAQRGVRRGTLLPAVPVIVAPGGGSYNGLRRSRSELPTTDNEL